MEPPSLISSYIKLIGPYLFLHLQHCLHASPKDFLKLSPFVTDISAVVKRLIAESLSSKFEKAKKFNVSESDGKKSDVGKFVA